MATDLKNMDGEPRDVARAAVDAALKRVTLYRGDLNEVERYVRNAFLTSVDDDDADAADLAREWSTSWEGRIMTFLKEKTDHQTAILKQLESLVHKYEGYDE